MKNVMGSFLKNKGWESWFEGFLYLFAVSLPIGHGIDAVMMAPLALCYLFVLTWNEKWENLKANRTSLLLLFSIPLLLFAGLFYSNNVDVALGRIERSLPLLILPIIIFSLPKRLVNVKKILYALGIGLLVVMLVSWGAIIADILSKASPMKQAKYFFEWIYTDRNLLRTMDIHPGYFVLFFVLFLTTIMDSKLFKGLREKRIFYYILLLLALLFLVETSSRVGFFCILLIMAIHFFRDWKGKRNWGYLFVFCGLFLAMFKFDYLLSKFRKLIDLEGNITFERYFRWKEIGKVFLDNGNILIGNGSGDIYEIYLQAYANGGFDQALTENYNAHNQYLEFLIGNGLLGLTVYLLVLVHFAIKTRLRDSALAFFILIVIFSFTESVLVRGKGVMFFAFFYPLFIKYYTNGNNE